MTDGRRLRAYLGLVLLLGAGCAKVSGHGRQPDVEAQGGTPSSSSPAPPAAPGQARTLPDVCTSLASSGGVAALTEGATVRRDQGDLDGGRRVSCEWQTPTRSDGMSYHLTVRASLYTDRAGEGSAGSGTAVATGVMRQHPGTLIDLLPAAQQTTQTAALDSSGRSTVEDHARRANVIVDVSLVAVGPSLPQVEAASLTVARAAFDPIRFG